MSEWVKSGLTYHQLMHHMAMGPGYKVSLKRPQKWGIKPVIPGLIVFYLTSIAAPVGTNP